MKREHRLNAQEEEALLRATEYEKKVLAYELETSTTRVSKMKEVCCSSQGGSKLFHRGKKKR